MSGRIKILDASGDAVQTANSPAIDYAYDTLSEFDEECGTFGLDEFQPGSGMCADTFLCGEGSATTLAFGECLKVPPDSVRLATFLLPPDLIKSHHHSRVSKYLRGPLLTERFM